MSNENFTFLCHCNARQGASNLTVANVMGNVTTCGKVFNGVRLSKGVYFWCPNAYQFLSDFHEVAIELLNVRLSYGFYIYGKDYSL